MLYGDSPNEPDRAARGQRGEIHSQHIGFDDAQFAMLRGLGLQARNQVAVDLDRGQRLDAIEQRPGRRALARADLDDAFARLRIDGAQDALDDAGSSP